MEPTTHFAGITVTPVNGTAFPAPFIVTYTFYPKNIYGHGHMEQVGRCAALWQTAVNAGLARSTDMLDFVFDGVDTFTGRRVRAGVPYNDEQRFSEHELEVIGTFKVTLA